MITVVLPSKDLTRSGGFDKGRTSLAFMTHRLTAIRTVHDCQVTGNQKGHGQMAGRHGPGDCPRRSGTSSPAAPARNRRLCRSPSRRLAHQRMIHRPGTRSSRAPARRPGSRTRPRAGPKWHLTTFVDSRQLRRQSINYGRWSGLTGVGVLVRTVALRSRELSPRDSAPCRYGAEAGTRQPPPGAGRRRGARRSVDRRDLALRGTCQLMARRSGHAKVSANSSPPVKC
jgi:hypothetical protein